MDASNSDTSSIVTTIRLRIMRYYIERTENNMYAVFDRQLPRLCIAYSNNPIKNSIGIFKDYEHAELFVKALINEN